MNGVTRSLCTVEDVRFDDRAAEGCRRVRLTLLDQNQAASGGGGQPRGKPVGRAYAVVQPASESLIPEPVKPQEEKVEVFKVYLEANRQEQRRQQQNLRMLSDEVSQIQEEAEEEAERAKLREVSKRLYAQLQEAEKNHQEERDRLQAEGTELRRRLSDQGEKLKNAEEVSERKDRRVEELQRLLGGMEQESASLREAIRDREDELRELRKIREEGQEEEQRAERLEKEVAVLKEKIHHLDDMLKSQQRKVRHMIEQLQNSRMVIQERDRVIRELEEKVAFLEAENREMHDQMDYFLGGQRSTSYLSSERNPQIVYSKPIKPSTSSNKPLPFIKVIEIKS
ncbi:tuftelin 1a isoform X2 [Lampris incognitus]|uniref:tuftelin 1a isoform X2 n=1 Tax=Lampris incognitus TaxID=2546036 RepID=UPI0024B609F3|nr:tuftelin 1a isoform X2 [Lampris incognitus]